MTQVIYAILSLFAAIFIFPLMVIVGLAVFISDGVPIIFAQKRVGLNGKEFKLYKFRTMEVLKGAENGRFDPGETKRVTKLGKFLRKTKLDELPSLWNVLKGDMSLVGPRPEVKKWVEVYPQRWQYVLSVKPGITDPASIEFRNEEEILAKSNDPEKTYKEVILPRKLELYEQYIKNRSFWGDIKILIKTVYVVLFK